MQDRRKNKRLELDVSLQLERLNDGAVTTIKYIDVEIFDISKSGMGFTSKRELELGTFYDAKVQIWTKEVIEAVIEVVRCEKQGDRYVYGSVFIGLMDRDALKIQIYEMFYDNN